MINNKAEGISIVHGNAKISPLNPNNNEDIYAGPICFRKCYINYLPFDVTVVERNGVRQRVKRQIDNYKKDFIIKTYYYIRSDGYDDAEKMFASLDDDSDQDMMLIKEVFYMNFTSKRVGGMTIILDSVITLDKFKENNSGIYYSISDILVSGLPLLECPAHPYNSKAIQSKDFRNIVDDEKSIGFNFELIDNNDKYGIRYINIAKQVYVITPKKDLVRKDGIYITTLEKNLAVVSGKIPIQKRYDIEGSEDTLGVYKTREECVAFGDIKTLRKEELTRLEHDFSIEKINLERENQELKTKNNKLDQDYKRELLKLEQENKERLAELNKLEQDRKEEYSKIKHEIDINEIKQKQETADIDRKYQIEMSELNFKNKLLEADLDRQRANTKDYYEGRSYSRRDTSELMKWLPTIITGVLGIIGIVFMKTKMAS